MIPTLKKRFDVSRRPWMEAIFSLAIALLVFTLILLNRSPNLLRPLSATMRTGFALIMAITVVLLYVSFRLTGWPGRLLALTLSMGLFALPLAGLWASGLTQSTVISGLIPLYDAYEYYIDALRLLAGRDFSVFSARRPLFPGLFAVVLDLSGRNLMVALAVLTALTGLACYLAAREIQRTHGAEAAVFALTILFLFYRAHSGISMSENLGLPLGTLGFVLMWRSASNHKGWLALTGIFILTLALNARAGTFFMLPFLMLWGGWFFRKSGKRFSWLFFFAGGAAVIAGFVANLLMVHWLATPSGVPFANFAYTLYGLASGGYSWAYVFQVHPEVLALQEPEQSRRIYQLAFELMRQQPWLTVQGAFHNWGMLFSESWYNIYSYVNGENRIVNLIARWGLYILCLLGFYKWFRNRSDPYNSLLMAATVGVLVSVPFLPPTDAFRMRPYAASIIVFGLVPAMGLVFLLERFGRGFFVKPLDQLWGREWSAGFTILLTMVTLVGPLIVKASGSSPRLPAVSCNLGMDSILIRYDSGTNVNIQRVGVQFLDWMPNFHLDQFRNNAHNLGDPSLVAWLESLRPPFSLFYALDTLSNRKALVTISSDLLPQPGSTYLLCGQWETKPELASYEIFYAKEVKPTQ